MFYRNTANASSAYTLLAYLKTVSRYDLQSINDAMMIPYDKDIKINGAALQAGFYSSRLA